MGLITNPGLGLTIGYVDQTERNRSRGGSLRTNVGPTWNVVNFDLPLMDETEQSAWLDIMRYCGTGRDLVLSIFPTEGTRRERRHTLNGLFISLDAIGRQVTWLTKRVQFEEN